MKKGLNQLISSLDSRNWVEKAIEEGMSAGNFVKPFTGNFSPSSAADCPRLIQLKMFRMVEKEPEPKGQRIFDNGNYVHSRYVDYFRKAKRLEQEESKFEFKQRDVVVSGRADVIVRDYEGNKHIGEMKSINDRRFTEILIANQPLEEHFLQWNLYSFGLNIQDGFILYENKNDQRLLIFPVKFDNNLLEQTINKFCYINDCTKKNMLVPKPEPCPNSHWCDAISICKDSSKTQEVLSRKITDFMVTKLEK